MYQIGKMPGSIDIGFVGETNYRKIEIDMTDWLKEEPDGVVSIIHMRPGEGKDNAYVAVTQFDSENNVLTWEITAADIGTHEGDGEMQIWLEVAEDDEVTKRGKSKRVITHVTDAVNNPDQTAPTSQAAFLEQVTEVKTLALGAKDDAEAAQAAAEAAQGAAEDAQDAAEGSAEDAEAYAKGTRDGSAVESEDPAYHNNAKYYSEQAGASATAAGTAKTGAETAEDNAEAWAKGTKNGTAIPDTDPAYHNNAKYYSEQAAAATSSKANLTVIAPAFDQATANDAGSLVTYTDGVVYVLPDGHTDGATWANTSKTATNIGAQLTDVKTAIQGKTDVFTDTIIGEIAHITDGAENLPVTELEFAIVPIQAGSGMPSVNNFREITGYTGASFKQSDADLNNPTTTSISWQTEAGTVYYAKFNLLTGKMIVTHKGYILAFSDMNNNEDYPGWNGVTGLRDCYVGVNGGATITLCNIFPPEKNTANIRINTNGINNIVFIPKSILGVSGQTEAKTRFAGKNLVFISPLITPVTIDFEPLTGIKTVLGENNFWSNTGETKVTYYCNTKKFVEKEAEKTVDPIDTSFFESINYFNQNDAEFRQGMYVNASGVIVETNTTNSIIIPVKPNTDYIFYIPNINRGYIATSITNEFEIGETYHLIKDVNVDNAPVSFTTDNVAKFAFIYFYSGSIYDYDANKGQAVVNIGTYTGTHRPVISNEYLPDGVSNVLNGANILIFGDSITDCCDLTVNSSKETTAYSWRNPSNSYTKDGTTINYSMWAKILKESQITGEIRNYAKAGAAYKTASRTSGNERQNLHYQIDIAMNDLDNPHNVFAVDDYAPDVVILALGTNDGNPNDTYDSAMQKTILKTDGYSIDVDATIANLDETKFCESARKAFLRIKAAFPVAQIYVVLPLQTASDDTNLGNIHSYLKQMAERYGAIIVDGTMNSGITRDFNIKDSLGVYLKDGLHPNEKGQNLLARLIISSLKANYIPFGYGFNQ